MIFARSFILFVALFLTLSQNTNAQHLESGQVFFHYSAGGQPGGAIVEANWVQVQFAQPFEDRPVVIAGPLSHTSYGEQNDDEPISLRLYNITNTGFWIAPQAPDGFVLQNLDLDAFWVAIPQGIYTLDSGQKIEGILTETDEIRAHPSVGGNSVNMDSVTAEHVFPEGEHVVLHTINSFNDHTWITTMIIDSTTNEAGQTNINFALEGAEVTSEHEEETVGFILLETGTGSFTDTSNRVLKYDIGKTVGDGDGRVVNGHDNGCEKIPNDRNFVLDRVPYVFASKTTTNGNNGGWLRRCYPDPFTQDITIQGFYGHIEEDQELNNEQNHVAEEVSYFAMEPLTTGHTVPLNTWEAQVSMELQAFSLGGEEIPSGAVLQANDVIEMRVTLANEGLTTITDNPGVAGYYGSIPTGTAYVDGSVGFVGDPIGSSGMYDNIIWWSGTLLPSESVTFMYYLEVQQLPHGDPIDINGTWFYDNTGNGDEQSMLRTFSLSSSNFSGALSILTSTDEEIPADGNSTTTIRLELKDSYGEPVEDGFVGFGGSLGTLLGSFTANAEPGVYTQELQSGTELGTSIITAYVETSYLNDDFAELLMDGAEPLNVEIDFVAGVPSCEYTILTATPSSITADGSSLVDIEIQLNDAFGQPVTGKEDSLATSSSGSATDLNDVLEQIEGFYVSRIIAPTVAETSTVTVLYNGDALCEPLSVEFLPGEVDITESLISVDPTEIPTGGEEATITVTIVDTFGNGIAGETVDIFTTPAAGVVISQPQDNFDGTYTAQLFSSDNAQTAILAFSVGGNIAPATATIVFKAADASMANSTISSNPTNVEVNTQSVITVTLLDDQNLPVDQALVEINIGGGNLLGEPVNIVGTGQYQVSWLAPTTAGSFIASFSASGENFPNTVTINAVPGAANQGQSSLTAEPGIIAGDNVTTTLLRVTLKDSYGNGIPGQTGNWQVALNNYFFGDLNDYGDGTYTSTFQGEGQGGYNVYFQYATFTLAKLVILIGADDDFDGDGFLNDEDNCVLVYNPTQEDRDEDGLGDACDDCPDDDQNDIDGDGICGSEDNCPENHNDGQEDGDEDNIGNVCDVCPDDPLNDIDGDAVCGGQDNCPNQSNENQLNSDGDDFGDQCDSCPFDNANDSDGDGHCADVDNCPELSNPGQEDTDGDNIGDACELDDADGDGIDDVEDNCPAKSNPTQVDLDLDGLGDACDDCPLDRDNDIDGDGTCMPEDNCPTLPNATQADDDSDGQGNLCDSCPNDAADDIDLDGLCADVDNCPTTFNDGQQDGDNDDIGDACDSCPTDSANDIDDDGLCADVDNCENVFNSDQQDSDGDTVGDVCDPCRYDAEDDADNDGHCADVDNCPEDFNPNQENTDGDEFGDVCEPPDADNDGILDSNDNCVNDHNPGQENGDGDSNGDACDPCPTDPNDVNSDTDTICDVDDNCPQTPNENQANADSDSLGDACDPCPQGDDGDDDGVCDSTDNCVLMPNADQQDIDSDGVGDECDACPLDPGPDMDDDGICESEDNCPDDPNPAQSNEDGDALGDACDPCLGDPQNGEDPDGDQVCGTLDNCPNVPNADQTNTDGDTFGDDCDTCPNDPNNDADADGLCADVDNCPTVTNPGQVNQDLDALGDLCDNCLYVSNLDQADSNNNGIGDACAQRYFGYAPNEEATLSITSYDKIARFAIIGDDLTGAVWSSTYENVGLFTGWSYGATTFFLRDLQDYIANQSSMSLPEYFGEETFELEMESKSTVILGFDCCNYSGSYFYPSTDGFSSYGDDFYIHIIAQGEWSETVIFANDEATTVYVEDLGDVNPGEAPGWSGELVQEIDIPAGGVFHAYPNNLDADNGDYFLQPGKFYRFYSSNTNVSGNDFAVMNNSGNGLTAVPPVPIDNDPDSNCNNSSGTLFYTATSPWSMGALAVFNDSDETSVFSITDIETGEILLANESLDVGTHWFQGHYGRRYVKIEFSQGRGAVWSGDTEGGDTINDMGDDLTMNFGDNAKRFVVHAQNQGAYIFAGSDNTTVTAIGTAPDGIVEYNHTFSMNNGDTQILESGLLFNIQSDKPIMVQTVGGNGLNDWATVLYPMPENDTSGNTDDCLNDTDDDGIVDADDNCVENPNPGQEDADGDLVGNACDNCPFVANPLQEDSDSNGTGDACTSSGADTDGDSILDDDDNCPFTSNIDQIDEDEDGKGNACDICDRDANDDIDGDGICGDVDNCPNDPNPGQEDEDGDEAGDVCDVNDLDLDGVTDADDNCPRTHNPDQADDNNNTIGDVCEIDCLDGIDGDRDGYVDEDAGECNDAIVVTCPDDIHQPVLDTTNFTASVGANSGLLVHEGWTMVTQPLGSSVNPNPLNSRSSSLTPLVAGAYILRYTAVNSSGEITACDIDYQAWVGDALRIELFWNLNLQEDDDNSDMDLHLAHENATSFFDQSWDCFYENCVGGNLNWGEEISEDNPRLDVDDTDGWGPENINIEQAEIGVRYRIGVHNYRNQNQTPARVQVRVYCMGEVQEELGPIELNVGQPPIPDNNDVWIIGDVIFSGTGCEINRLTDDNGGPLIITGGEATETIGPSCATDVCFSPSCPGFEPVPCGYEGCENGVDDDGDNLADCLDEDCWGESVCTDSDIDGVPDVADNCPDTFNPEQVNSDTDPEGDACDECPEGPNDIDSDEDGQPDGCDECPYDANNDVDLDEVCGEVDNCPDLANSDQADLEQDGIGDACDDDDDNDTVPDTEDNCQRTPNPDQIDLDDNGIGDACEAGADTDVDGIEDENDNCPLVYNPDQIDTDGTGGGDACDSDDDADGVEDEIDNCQYTINPDQEDQDENGIGDACDDDRDGDGVDNDLDNCPDFANENQNDMDVDGIGDVCDDDRDGDNVENEFDNCPWVPNEGQEDADGDSIGDQCDSNTDVDGDNIQDSLDNCPDVANPDQEDMDLDGTGDACDPDRDGDGVDNDLDNCPDIANVGQENNDADESGDICDLDDDNDEVEDIEDNCPFIANTDQADTDSDGQGDLCDEDLDGDGVNNDIDNCPYVENLGQADLDQDGLGDVCDPDDDGDEIEDDLDNCPIIANGDQLDTDEDGEGDVCDEDDDADGILDDVDNCPLFPNTEQNNQDADEYGDACDDDIDGDGVPQIPTSWFFDGGTSALDNCPLVPNEDQEDVDNDGIGDACDANLDTDGDGIDDGIDNCPTDANPQQEDMDFDGTGDACDEDTDGDGVENSADNCPSQANVEQEDLDEDGEGNVCDSDIDGDGVPQVNDPSSDAGLILDNCPMIANPDQADSDNDGIGDVCDDNPDMDGDGLLDNNDNCPQTPNPEQEDADTDGIGDVCDDDDDNDTVLDTEDNCPVNANADQNDIDQDGLGDLCDSEADGDGLDNENDNCAYVPNVEQADLDEDGIGDVCDEDLDGDTIENEDDNCPRLANTDQEDSDEDGIGDACDTNSDFDEDGMDDGIDNCPLLANPEQEDQDGDGIGDICDGDLDGDGIENDTDNCINIPNNEQLDSDDNGIGDACDDGSTSADGGVVGDGGSVVIVTDAGDNPTPNVDGGSVDDPVDVDGGSDSQGGTLTAGGFFSQDEVVFIAAPGCGCNSSGVLQEPFMKRVGALLYGIGILFLLRRRRKED